MQIEALEPRCHLSAGQLDTTFGDRGKLRLIPVLDYQQWIGETLVQPDGKLLVSTQIWRNGFELRRYNVNYKLDRTFGKNGMVQAYAEALGLYRLTTLDLALQEDEKILRLFRANDIRGRSGIQMVERRHSSGLIDRSFGQMGRITLYKQDVIGTHQWARHIEPRPGGGVVVSGTTMDGSFVSRGFTADGSPDPSYGTRGRVLYRSPPGVKLGDLAMHRLDSGELLFIGTNALNTYQSRSEYATQLIMVRFDRAGQIDKTFGRNGISRTFLVPSRKRAAGTSDWIVSDDGSVLVSVAAYQQSIYLMRFDSRGRLDSTFGYRGRMVLHKSRGVDEFSVVHLTPMADNKVSFVLPIRKLFHGVYSDYEDILVGRVTPSGRLDRTFGSRGTTIIDRGGTYRLSAVHPLPDDDLLLLAETAQHSHRWAVAMKING